MMNSTHPVLNLVPVFEEMAVAEAEGVLLRRILSGGFFSVFVGMRKPSNIRLMRISFPLSAVTPDWFDLPPFRSLVLKVETENEVGSTSCSVVTLEAPYEQDNDIFTRLVEDVASVTIKEVAAEAAACAFQARLLQWQRLLQKDRWNGLSDEEQRGLYGELCVLEEQVLTVVSPVEAIAAWTGPERTAKDFYFTNGLALEVKTTLSHPPYEIQIASERQLDDTGLSALFLIHRLIDAQRGSGETLPDRVARLRISLSSTPTALSRFEERLEESGYFDIHSVRYQEVGFTRRSTHMYAVRDEFPRIVGVQLPSGVGNVQYLISASACAPFEMPLPELSPMLKGL